MTCSFKRTHKTHTHTLLCWASALAMMATLLDPHKHFSAEQHAIRRLDAGPETGVADQPFAPCHPRAERVNPAPSRDDVPLLDPCCGHLSAGAEVYLGVRARPRFIDVPHVASALWVPPGFKETPLTAANPSGICADLREDKAWNSRRIPDAVLRARLSGKMRLCLYLIQITLCMHCNSGLCCRVVKGA